MSITVNLDRLAAEYSQKMVSESKNKEEVLERVVTKSLGVLQEQGVYAMMLFLFSRSGDEKEISKTIRNQLYFLLFNNLPSFKELKKITFSFKLSKSDKEELDKILKFYSSPEIMEDIDTLFLIRDLYEQTLIYARYSAKAAKKAG